MPRTRYNENQRICEAQRFYTMRVHSYTMRQYQRVFMKAVFQIRTLVALFAGMSVFGQAQRQIKQQNLENPAEIEICRGPIRDCDVSVKLHMGYAVNVIPNPATVKPSNGLIAHVT